MASGPDTSWLSRETILLAVLVAVSVLATWLCWLLVRPFVEPITWALALTVIAGPIHDRVRRVARNRNLAAFVSVVAITVMVALPAGWLVREVASELGNSSVETQALFDQNRWKKVLNDYPQLAPARQWLNTEIDRLFEPEGPAAVVGTGLPDLLGRVVTTGTTSIVALLLLFYFIRDKDEILDTLKDMLPLSAAEGTRLLSHVGQMAAAVVFGTLVVAALQGALGGLAFWFLGLPSPVLWGAAMGLFALLPFFGAAIVWVPAAGVLALSGEWQKALALVGWGVLVVGLADNLLLPALMRNRIHMHTLPIFVSAVGGLLAFGAAGLVLGPLVLASSMVLLDIWRQRMAARSIATGINKRVYTRSATPGD